ncbi:MAG: phosphoenolpyruvate--protein phosphotransferase, partial [Sphingomicrobium sp.]
DARGPGQKVVTRTVKLSLPHGIHARPAARIGECARKFESDLQVICGGKRADARSTVGLLALGTCFGHEVSIEASGADAEAALDALVALLSSDMGEPADAAILAATRRPDAEPGQVTGVVAAPGLAMGPAFRLRDTAITVVREGREPETERAALVAARTAVREAIAAQISINDGNVAAVMNSHLALLDDPQLSAAAEASIASGTSAAFAWRSAVREQVDALLQTGNARLADRTSDLVDIERQVLSALSGAPAPAAMQIPDGAILIADDLLPSQLVSIAKGRLAGVCLQRGGPTSHVAILCAGMGIPAIVAMGDPLAAVEDGAVLLLDADAGRVTIAPSSDVAETFAARLARRADRRQAARAASADPCQTADGTRVHFFANLGSVEDARSAAAEGAEGSGLVRSEFLFLGRGEPPSEDDQLAAYQAIADALPGRPILFRLLDVGGDKPAEYIPIAPEANPALGLRGIRVGLAHPELLETQISAILRVRPASQCRIMIPMVTSADEVRAVRAIVDRGRTRLGISESIEVGVMVETPAAAATADLLSSEADFLSIGTNDLTQYVLAMDRGNPSVAAGVDGMHPAVLRMIAQTCRLAGGKGRWVGVCGGLASDPAALPILIGLGVTELSSVPSFVAEGKAIVRALTLADTRAHAARVLQCSSASEVRAMARAFAEAIQ